MGQAIQQHQERRRYPRHPARDLVARIGAVDYPVENISLDGVRLSGGTVPRDRIVTVVLRHTGPLADSAGRDATALPAQVVDQTDSYSLLRFQRTSVSLLRLICDQVSINLGVCLPTEL
ncbi:MAG: hypothetical protein F8N37_15825 [Telmatospirillum sp.]|nr:hypothetical protein [Telmatospirillum sp.]